jgi:low affinity Fe/Cu permease
MEKLFSHTANNVAHAAGKPLTFVACCLIIVVWALTGPVFGFSDTWQLIINTGTTIVTFLMVFLIQNTQNRDGAAIQAKLDELIRVSTAQNRFIGIEHLTETEVEQYRALCEKAAKAADRAEQAEAQAEKAESQAEKEASPAKSVARRRRKGSVLTH